MKLRPYFYQRDFSKSLLQADWLLVMAASWAAVGGCDRARLAGHNAGRLDLPQLLGLLRCPVELQAEDGTCCWWGYVNGFELWAGNLGAVCSLDRLSNRMRTRYDSLEGKPGDPALKIGTFTAWADYLDTQATYGVKEKMVRLLAATASQAEKARDLELVEACTPVVLPAVRTEGGASLALELRGWWHTAGWRYYEQAAGLVEHQGETMIGVGFGDTSGRLVLAQCFTTGAAGWTPDSIWLRARKVGVPADNVLVGLYTDNAGAPGGGVGLCTFSGANLPLDYRWTKFVLAAPSGMAANTKYWIAIQRSGAASATNYYQVCVDEGLGFAGGNFVMYTNPPGGYVTRAPDCDLHFRVIGNIETTEQIKLMAASTCGGQFFTAVEVATASGVYSNPLRDGTVTALAELVDQLKAGTSAGLGLLAEVDRQRVLRITTQPAAENATLHVDRQGAICDPYLNHLPAWEKAAGRWAIVDSAWKGQGSGLAKVKDRVFLQAVEYDPAGGYLRPGAW